jgi:hypothetical protein
MIIPTKPFEVTQQALAVLIKEIGVVNTVRFLNQFTTGYGDYTAERDTLDDDCPGRATGRPRRLQSGPAAPGACPSAYCCLADAAPHGQMPRA